VSLSPGQILNNRYRIDNLIAQGGFGAVYYAYDFALKRFCALKENLETDSDAQRQFELEATVLAGLSHANLPRVIDHFVISGQGQYLVMDYVEGEDLQEMLDRVGAPLPESQVLLWIEQICDALIYLHSQHPSIIHRDVKPANIRLLPDGQTVKLVDFGIIKVGGGPTAKAARGATEGYSPPEQYGTGKTDARSDVYALGATLYALLTGQQPPASTDRAAGSAFLLPPRNLNPGISPHIETAIQKAMALSQMDRFQTIAELQSALQISRMRSAWIVIIMCLVVTGIILGVIFTGSGPQSSGRETAPPTRTTLAPTGTPVPVSSTMQEGSASPTAQATTAIYILHSTQTAVAVLEAVTPTPSATPTLDINATLVSLVDGMVMMYVPEGEILMGASDSDTYADDDERPQHVVYLDAYWIDKTEVTNSKYLMCVNAGECSSPTEISSETRSYYYGNTDYADFPVIYVTWYDAVNYCHWAGRRLPTEAEWEKAARWNPVTGTVTKYPWGIQALDTSRANVNNWYGDTMPVGSFPDGASHVGVLDMIGNVGEWIADFYNEIYYKDSPYMNPQGPTDGIRVRAMRGRAYDKTMGFHASFRYWGLADVSFVNDGFRCVMDVEP
jgi:eukaryotic-like serine/threonine-protein kinase